MTLFFVSLVVMLLYGLSAYGWGLLTTRLLYGDTPPGWAFTTALGVAIWIFVGGVLNVLHLISAYTLFAITGLGLAVSAMSLFSAWRDRRNTVVAHAFSSSISAPWIRYLEWLPRVIILVTFVFLVATLMPTLVFNFHDDMHTYMMRPMRMLQTGTVGGDPFDVLGLDSLGAQAFLHAFVVAYFRPAFLNGVDAIFCFTLGGLLLLEIGRWLGAGWVAATLSLLAYIVIHPQYVNISTLYSGILMVLGMVYASLLLIEPHDTDLTRSLAWRTISPALFTAALLALKTTFALFAVMYWALFFTAQLVAGSDRRRILKMGVPLVLIGAALIAPWVSLHMPHYLEALARASEPTANGNPFGASLVIGGNIKTLFSLEKLFLGGSLLDYHAITLLLALAFGVALRSLWRSRGGVLCPEHVTAFAMAGAAPAAYLLNGHFFGLVGVRYSVPILIAGLSATAILLARPAPVAGAIQRNALRVSVTTALTVVLVLFSGQFLSRLRLAYDGHTLVSFPVKERYYTYMENALGEPARHWVNKAQLETEHDTTILAWISVPFHLDFHRNRILTVSEPGLVNPWLRLPVHADSEALRGYLRTYGVRYVLLEHKRGLGIKPDSILEAYANSLSPVRRKTGETNLYFRHALLALAERSRIVSKDERVVLYEITDDGPVSRP